MAANRSQNQNGQQQSTQRIASPIWQQVAAQQAMLGNGNYIMGALAGKWLNQYLQKLLEKLFIKEPSGKVNGENVNSGVTDALNQGLGGTPEELLQQATGYNSTPSYDFPNSNLENLTTWEQRRAEIEKNNPYNIDTSFEIPAEQQVTGKTLNSRYLDDNVPVNLQEWTDSKFPIKGNFSFTGDNNPLPKGQYNPKVTAPSQEEQFSELLYNSLKGNHQNSQYGDLWSLYPAYYPAFWR